jgi:hypothetical protein
MSVAEKEIADLISSAVGIRGVARKCEQEKAREGSIYFLCGVIA